MFYLSILSIVGAIIETSVGENNNNETINIVDNIC